MLSQSTVSLSLQTIPRTERIGGIKGELKPEISLLYMKVLTLIKAKSNVSL